jgi:hypothetical protein
MPTSPKSASHDGTDAEARLARRAEIERKVAEGRAKLLQDRELKLKADQDNEARKQAQMREAVLQAVKEKDELLARQLAQREEQEQRSMQEQRSFLVQLSLNPVEKIKEAKVCLSLNLLLLTCSI